MFGEDGAKGFDEHSVFKAVVHVDDDERALAGVVEHDFIVDVPAEKIFSLIETHEMAEFVATDGVVGEGDDGDEFVVDAVGDEVIVVLFYEGVEVVDHCFARKKSVVV